MTDTTNAAAATTTGTNTTATTGASDQTWFSTFDDETKGYLQNRGLASKTAADAFLIASKSHREAERLIGAPANEMLRLPKDPASPDWQNVWKRLGKPNGVEDYKLEGVKHENGNPIDQGLADTLRKAAFDANLNPELATNYAKQVITHLDRLDATKRAEQQQVLQNEQKLLKDNWGNNFAANKVVASSAAEALGVSKEELEALGNTRGYAKVMEMFRNIGTKIGEDRFVNSQGGSGTGSNVMTKDQAKDEKKSLMADTAWVKRYLSGGVDEKRKMTALDTIIAGV